MNEVLKENKINKINKMDKEIESSSQLLVNDKKTDINNKENENTFKIPTNN